MNSSKSSKKSLLKFYRHYFGIPLVLAVVLLILFLSSLFLTGCAKTLVSEENITLNVSNVSVQSTVSESENISISNASNISVSGDLGNGQETNSEYDAYSDIVIIDDGLSDLGKI